jgi:hypothetical protein
MMLSPKDRAIVRFIGTQDYRKRARHERALLLHEELSVSKTESGQIVSMAHTSVNRAIRAREEGRELGRNGRPPIFDKADIEELLRRLYRIREERPLTREILKQEVRSDEP